MTDPIDLGGKAVIVTGAGVVLRLLRTGEESLDIPHGPEQPGLAQVPSSSNS